MCINCAFNLWCCFSRFQTKVLNLRNLKREDRGVYRCLADNNVRPPATYDATLYVSFRPYSRYVQSTYGQAQNRLFDLTIECIVSGGLSFTHSSFLYSSPGRIIFR